MRKSATRKKSSTTTNSRVSDGASHAEFNGVGDFEPAFIKVRDEPEKQFCLSSNEAEVIRRTQKLEVFIYTSESAESSIVRFGMLNGSCIYNNFRILMSQFGGIPQTKFQNGAVLMTRASFQQKWGLGSPRRNALKPSRMEIRTVHRIRSSLVCPGRRQELWGRSYSRSRTLEILTSQK